MAAPATPLPGPALPAPDPQAIRAGLTSALAAEFDSEWETVLERAKQSKNLAGVHDMLSKWRHTAYLEMRDPGAYYRMLAKAEQIIRTGRNPDAVSMEDMQALLRQRMGR
jgi:hypothetical protein